MKKMRQFKLIGVVVIEKKIYSKVMPNRYRSFILFDGKLFFEHANWSLNSSEFFVVKKKEIVAISPYIKMNQSECRKSA